MKAVYLALLGLVTVQGVQLKHEYCIKCEAKHNDHKIRDALSPPADDYYNIKDSDIWSENVQLEEKMADPEIATKWDKDHPHPGFLPGHDGFEGSEGLGKYDREVPANFDGPGKGNHEFMYSMISKYATELATDNGVKTGKFVLKKDQAKAAATEVIGTHMGLKGKEADDYLASHFDATWEHFDSKPDGWLDAQRMSTFMRYLCNNQTLDLLLAKKNEFHKTN